MYHCGSCMNSYRHRQSLSRHRQKCEGKPFHDSDRQSHEQNCFNPKMEVDDSTEDVQLTDRYEPREKGIGSCSLNPKQNIYCNDGSRVKDEYSDESSMKELDSSDGSSVEDNESSMKELDKNRISSYALSEPVTRRHCVWLPASVRAIIVGKSGSGKTTLLNYLLLAPKPMKYDNLIVCGRSLHQPEYQIMQQVFGKGLSNTQVGALFVNKERAKEESGSLEQFIEDYSLTCKGGVDAVFFEDVARIPDPCEHDASKKNVLVLDDVMLGPQNKVEAYFTRGRHNNVDVIYITQSYFRLPRQTIRENANMFIFFKQDRKNLMHIFNDHCAGDGIPFELFCRFCNQVWGEGKHNFVTIDLTRPVELGKYRSGLNDFWINPLST